MTALYHKDSKGNIRVWWMEREGSRYRTASGIHGGAITYSGWNQCFAKNIGKKNETSAEQQAILEIEAQYKKKLARKYYENKEDAAGTKYIAPMLAISYKDYKKRNFPVYVQPKLDGIRAVVTKDGIFSREGKPLLGVRHISAILEDFFQVYPEIILDGEMYNHELKDDFNSLTSWVKKESEHSHKIQFHVYDIINEEMPFSARTMLLAQFMRNLSHPWVYMVQTHLVMDEDQLDTIYARFLEDRYEGQMIRIPSGLYEGKRSKNLIKRKEFQDAEFPVVAIEEGKGNWAGMAKRVVCRLPDGRTFEAGLRGTQDENRQLLARWIAEHKPKFATIRFQNLTPDGIPRFGVAVAFYDDERDL